MYQKSLKVLLDVRKKTKGDSHFNNLGSLHERKASKD